MSPIGLNIFDSRDKDAVIGVIVFIFGKLIASTGQNDSITRLPGPITGTKYLFRAALYPYYPALTRSIPMPEPPILSLATVQSTLGSAARWSILRELADGSSLLVSELAARTRMTSSAVSKQLNALVADRIVIHPRGRLYEIAPQFFADKTERVLDFGYCLVRMNAGSEQRR